MGTGPSAGAVRATGSCAPLHTAMAIPANAVLVVALNADRTSSDVGHRNTHDVGAQESESRVDSLVSSVDLFDVADGTSTFGPEAGDEERHTGAYVGARQSLAIQPGKVPPPRPGAGRRG